MRLLALNSLSLEYKNSRIVYLMLGHDHQAYENPVFRKLINNSINWVSQDR